MGSKIIKTTYHISIYDWSTGYTESFENEAEAKRYYNQIVGEAFKYGDHIDAVKVVSFNDGTTKESPVWW